MKITTQTITPEIAETLLAGNTRNRALNENHVRSLMREMLSGRWKVTGDPIRFNGSHLIDGQHRLEACRRTRIPFTTVVVEGLQEDVFDAIDCGKPRNGGDTLALRGEKNTAKLAAALQVVGRYKSGRMLQGVRFSNTELLGLLEKYPGVRGSVERCGKDKRILLPFSILAGFHYLFSEKDPSLADLVVEQILHGNGLRDHDPMKLFRERLVTNSLSKAKLSSTYLAALFVKAWNHTREGSQIRQLRYTEEGDRAEVFPEIR